MPQREQTQSVTGGFDLEEIKTLSLEEQVKVFEDLKTKIEQEHPLNHNPVVNVRWVPFDKVTPNEYNPNRVARNEMHLLYTSVDHDGYTQPIVTVHDKETDLYVIVDGFHRYSIMKENKSIKERNHGYLPVVVIDKSINDRIASTVRHNRARGKHQVAGMSDIVFKMLENGWTDSEICNEIGMEPTELTKLKHITGFSKLFEDVEYRKAWETTKQLKAKREAGQ